MSRKIGIVLIALMLSACSILPDSVDQIVNPILEGSNKVFSDSSATATPVICPTCAALCTTITPATPTTTKTASPTTTYTTTPTKTLTSTPYNTQNTSPSKTPTKSATATSTSLAKPYTLQANTPIYQTNFAQPTAGCNWMGVAGQVFDLNGNPVKNLVLIVEGTLNNIPVDSVGVTGANLPYGPSGFEILLSRIPLSSTGTLSITLYDLAGKTLSTPVMFNTYGTCDKNLIIINFKQTSP